MAKGIFKKISKIVDRSNIADEKKPAFDDAYNKGAQTGISNTEIQEPIPTVEFAPCETRYVGKNNAYMILGRDRPAGRSSGFGGKGATQCGRIDLCAGIGSSFKRKDNTYGPPNEKTIISPNFATTASRIYITQRGYIDKYMGLAEDKGFTSSKGRAAIGLKSDCIRIHGRQNIKIITGKSKFEGLGSSGERLSTGGEFDGVGTISFIAGNYTEAESGNSLNIFNPSNLGGTAKRKLQPIVKGENLLEAFEDLLEILHEINRRINENSRRVDQIANSFQNHFHDATPGFGGPSTPSFTDAFVGSAFTKLMTRIDKFHNKVNDEKLKAFKTNFLEPAAGASYINSKYVFTT